jgi:hypothetical protein
MAVCKHCKHADYAHVKGECVAVDARGMACGCVKFEARPKREDKHRTWVVRVAFFEFNKWTPEKEVKVKAQGIGGAAMKAVRQVKHERTSKKRVLQTRITVVPVGRGSAAS